jgi:hypothetical protein
LCGCSEVKRICSTKKYCCRKLGVNFGNSMINCRTSRKPLKGPGLVVSTHLSKQRSIGRLRNCPLPQLSMESRDHLGLSVRRASDVVRGSQRPNLFRSGIVVINSDEVARVEIDHTVSRSRSSLISFVISSPPWRCLRCARYARVNRGFAKNAFSGAGWAGIILAINRPRSVTFTSPLAACRTHAPVAR